MTRIQKIKVLVVDDSRFFRNLIKIGLSADSVIEVVGEASDAIEAAEMIRSLKPHVLVLDFQMPKINGIEFLKELLPEYPIPVILISSTSGLVFDAMKAGAVDFVAKPDSSGMDNMDNFIKDLVFKVKIASTARVGRKPREEGRAEKAANSQVTEALRVPAPETLKKAGKKEYDIIAIGASTGGTEATNAILEKLPENSPAILIVQHMPPRFTKMYADRLNSNCRVRVLEASDGDEISRGTAYIAPGGYHMQAVRKCNKYYIKVFEGEKVNGHCPSVDVLFDSVAETYGERAIGIILTGMGADGAKGLLHMKNKGALTLGQDEKSSVVYGMPKVAYELGAVAIQGNIEAITDFLLSKLK